VYPWQNKVCYKLNRRFFILTFSGGWQMSRKVAQWMLIVVATVFGQISFPNHLARVQAAALGPDRCSKISQWGIIWTFDQIYPCGQFINGDYWVTPNQSGGTVRITGIFPSYAGGRNGWQVNPDSTKYQGLDGLAPDFQASLVADLPYDATPGSSIIQAVSNPGGCGKTCLSTAAVLTVLAAAPEDNGTTVFRPPYFAKEKPIFSAKSIHWELVPKLISSPKLINVAPSLPAALAAVQRVQLAFKSDWSGDTIHPSMNFQLPDPYGPDVSNQNVNAMLRAMLEVPGDSPQVRRAVVIALIQYGIDNYGVLAHGGSWPSNGGHDLGMRLPIVLAGFFLNNSALKQAIAKAPRQAFAETDMIYASPHTGVALWGQSCGPPQAYWDDITLQATRTCRDPYGYIDGGPKPGTWYQLCCSSQALKGIALVVRLVPGLEVAWSDDTTLNYADRWVTQGALAQPDPCAAIEAGGGAILAECRLDAALTPGSTFNHFSCAAGKQCGRFPSAQTTNADQGLHRSAFVDAMWMMFRTKGTTVH
jgi:hypothetical protein